MACTFYCPDGDFIAYTPVRDATAQWKNYRGGTASRIWICDLADRYDALVMVDDSHAVGFVGDRGRGTPEYCGVEGRIDILTGTLGKALGGASGGYTSASKPVVEWLRQRSRPYLFSSTLMPAIAGASLKVLDMIEQLESVASDARKILLSLATRVRFETDPSDLAFTGIRLQDDHDDQETDRDTDHEHLIIVIGTATLYPLSPMTIDEFRTSLAADGPPDVPPLLQALWHDAKGHWDEAHTIAQNVGGKDGARVHAYLHRKEGDLSNARYWYGQAREAEATDALDSEWTRIAQSLLDK